MKNNKLEEGDIFYVKCSNKFIFARILLDVDDRILKIEPDHKIKFYSGCYLIEIYKGIYDDPILASDEIVLPSQFTFKKYFYSKKYKIDWIFYQHIPIDCTKIDFPESLETGRDGLINFRKFDLSLPTKTLFSDFPVQYEGRSSQRYTGSLTPSFYGLVDEAFHLQSRDDLMRVSERTHFLDKSDLRLVQKDRSRFYDEIGENMNIAYYKLALKHGFDLGRFYGK